MIDPAACLKLIADLALYFAVAGFVLPSRGAVVPALLLAAGGMLGSILMQKRAVLRLLALLPVGAALLFIRSGADAVLLLPPAAYVAALIITRRFGTDRYTFAPFFRTAAAILPLASLIFVLFERGGSIADNVLPYAAAFLVAGLLLMRLLRQDEATRREPAYLALNLLLPALAVFAAAALASTGFRGAAGNVCALLYQKLVYPLLIGISYAAFGVVWVLQKGLGLLLGKRTEAGGGTFALDLGELPEQSAAAGDTGNALVGQILLALGILAFLIVAALLFGKLLGMRQDAGKGTGASARSRVEGTATGFDLRALLRPRTNRDAVRQTYQRFLALARTRGVVLSPSHTSADIARICAASFAAERLAALRALYIAARYSEREPSREDVRHARAILAALKKEPMR